MGNIVVRRYVDGDETAICEIVKKAVLSENIKDYSKTAIDHLVESHNADLIKRRAKAFHVYVLTDEDKIIGVGMIVGYFWNRDLLCDNVHTFARWGKELLWGLAHAFAIFIIISVIARAAAIL